MSEDNAPRHALLALLLATDRFNEAELVSETGLAPQHIDVVRRSPLFLEAVRRFRERLAPADVGARLKAGADHNVAWLEKVRDGSESDDPKALRLRLSAAQALLDKQVARAGGERAEGGVKIVVIDGRALDRIEQTRRETAITVEALPAPTDGDAT